MNYHAKSMANFVLDLAERQQLDVTPMKLLKLIYFAHGWHLAIKGESLIDDHVEAWKFGPVVPSIYHSFKQCGMNPIGQHRAVELDMDAWRSSRKIISRTPTIEETPSIKTFIEKILEVYGKLSALQLSNLTHQPDSPWYKVWYDGGGKDRPGADIPDDLIRDYFLRKAKT